MADLRETNPILWRAYHQFDRATYRQSYSGTILVDDIEICRTSQCCHCGAHFPNLKIPGKERGWCMNCNAPVCPNPACDDCVPFFQFLDNIERNLPPGHRPIMAAVRGDVPTTLINAKPLKKSSLAGV